MDYVKPTDVVQSMVQGGLTKSRLSFSDLMIRGFLSGAFLGFSTTLAITATDQTGLGIVGAIIFPVGFVMIVLLGLELVTGSFALLPMAFFERKLEFGRMMYNLSVVFLANLIGSVVYGVLFWIALTKAGQVDAGAIGERIVAIAEGKTLGYSQFGASGMLTVFTKAVLCNWMVTMGVVMAMTSSSTLSKIIAAWLPIFIFFAQGFEHSVVNMFVIPTGMLLGAKVSLTDWWVWNQIPVTLGNIVGGVVFTALALYLTHGKKKAASGNPVITSTEPTGELVSSSTV